MVAGAYGASAQGFVNFNNSVSAATKISVNSTYGGPATGLTPAVANGFYYELFFSKSTATEAGAGTIPPAVTTGSLVGNFVTGDSSWTDGLAQAASSATAGRVLGGANEVVTGVAGATSANFVLIGWSANIGSTIQALDTYLANPTPLAAPAFFGESQVANLTLGDGAGTSTPNLITSTTIPGFLLGEIQPTPEPTTIALGVMGAASLLALRRKKA